MSEKDVEVLKREFVSLQEKNTKLFEQDVLPAIAQKKQAFLDAFEDYFRERGFIVKKRNGAVRVSYDYTLQFKAFSNESDELFIMKGKEQIACISLHFKGEENSQINSQRNNPTDSIHLLEKEIEREKMLSMDLVEPEIYYAPTNSQIFFDNPYAILESIFQI
ncbi:hypothetical protein G4D61_08405 [Bacillus ginsengihumi]|uniref:Uncharacterized protein n=1 Tax=Heyndrickxia ginsengihumi TaxID=363870 RepID=A0A0A6VI81_9BACI|nr:hypothetical protein [Heyndrickxia ginsengihumi]KHD86319.1 hypothetical protein NG54_03980 [Heyndrickxia ginsengihumi]MCM3023169.1 hypothetical protein [Heyndrickxia ginsengihumi]NEY19987.1 hypothetical protein [Heyndrickxia ginsengihumi]